MTRNMMSFNGFGPGFNPTTDIGSLPDDYNKTDSEIVELGGHRYVKKTTTLKKGGPGSSFFVRSTTYERVDDSENGADLPSKQPEDQDSKKEVRPEESQPESSSTGAPALPSDPKEGPAETESESSPKDQSEPLPSSSDGPDVVPSSESPAAAAGEADEPVAAESENAGEREGESSAASTEQP